MKKNKICTFCEKKIDANGLMAYERGKWYHYGKCALSHNNILAIEGKKWNDKILHVMMSRIYPEMKK